MKRFLLFAGVLSAGVAASAGAQQSTPVSQLPVAQALPQTQAALTSPPVDGMVWELQTLSNGPTRLTVLKPGLNNPTVQFGGRSATGSTFCNLYSASYVSRGDLLRFGPTLTTRRACLPQTDKLEQQFLKLLEGTNRYSVDGNVLTLYTGADGRLIFQKRSGAKPAQPPSGQVEGTMGQTQPQPVPIQAAQSQAAQPQTQQPQVTQPPAQQSQSQPVMVQPTPTPISPAPVTRPTTAPVVRVPAVSLPRGKALPAGKLPSAVTIFDRATASNLGPDEDLLIVGSVRTACTGLAQPKSTQPKSAQPKATQQGCLIVKHPGDRAWSLFSAQIEGFHFRAGVTSLLRVRVERLARPAADGSSLRYRLVRVLGTQTAR